jgi:hypothetical protein
LNNLIYVYVQTLLKTFKSKVKDKHNIEHTTEDDIFLEESAYETMLLSEESLAKDWLSEEDSEWDDVL